MSEIDPGLELEKLRAIPIEDRTKPIEELVEKLERQLEQMSAHNAEKEFRTPGA